MAFLMIVRSQFDNVRPSAYAAFVAAFSNVSGMRISRRAVLTVGFLLMAPSGEHASAKHRTEFPSATRFVLENAVVPVEFRNQFVEADPIVSGVAFLGSHERLNCLSCGSLACRQFGRVKALLQRTPAGRPPAIRCRRMAFFGRETSIPCSDQVARRRIALCEPFGCDRRQPRSGLSTFLSLAEVFSQSSHTYNLRHSSARVKENLGDTRG